MNSDLILVSLSLAVLRLEMANDKLTALIAEMKNQ